MTQELVFDPQTQTQKDWAWWLYVLHGISLAFSLGLLSWIPLILNYVKRDDAAGTFVHSHHAWQIRSFWWYWFWLVLGAVVGGLLFITLVGIPLAYLVWSGTWAGAWLWKAYRLIKGFLDLAANKPMPG